MMENGAPFVVKGSGDEEDTIEIRQVSKDQAYDIARKEFYTVRQQEQIRRRIAIEEARMVGGYFGKSRLEIGMELEDKMYDKWRAWAERRIEKKETERGNAYQTFGGKEPSEEAAELADLAIEAEQAESEEAAPRL